MRADVMVQEDILNPDSGGVHCEWVRLNFTGMTPGNPPIAAFQGRFLLLNGETRHTRLSTSVQDENLQLRLLNLPAGTEVRILIETDWKKADLPAELKDVLLVTEP